MTGSVDRAESVVDSKMTPARAECYLTGARIVESLRRAEDIDIDGPGLAAHQIETVLGIPEDEAAEVCRLLVGEGYATEHTMPKGTPFWRYREVDDDA